MSYRSPTGSVAADLEERVLTLRLNRPEALNALRPEMLDALRMLVEQTDGIIN